MIAFVWRGLVHRPNYFPKRDRLADKPTAWPNCRIVLAPMFRFIDGLAVEFENELRMTGFQNVGIDILVTGDASVGTDIKISEIVHARADTGRVSPIGASMSAQPRFGRAVTIFARHAFVRTRARGQSICGHGLKWRVTNCAACARLRLGEAKRFADPRGARVEQNRVSPGVKIFLRPGDVLAAFFTGATVATGRFTTDGADESGGIIAREHSRAKGNEREKTQAQHALRLANARIELPR